MEDESFKEVEQQYKIAEARFDVADHLGYWTAIFAGTSAYLYSHTWYLGIAFGIIVFMAVTYTERREYKIACKAYEHSTGSGYFEQ